MTYWLLALTNTFELVFYSTLISLVIGLFTSITAWLSNYIIFRYIPIFLLIIPTWLLGYEVDIFNINNFTKSVITLGICSSIYVHTLVLSSLISKSSKYLEMLLVLNGRSFSTLYLAVKPSLYYSLLPAIAIVVAEVISDFGVSNYYGINTLTMSVYNIWSSTWNINNISIGLFMLLTISILLGLLSNNKEYSVTTSLNKKKNIILGLISTIPTLIVIGFTFYSILNWGIDYKENSFTLIKDSLLLVLNVILIGIMISFIYIYFDMNKYIQKVGIILYSIPSLLLASLSIIFLSYFINLFYLLVFTLLIRYFGLVINSIYIESKGESKSLELISFYSNNKIEAFKYKINILYPAIFLGTSIIALDVLRELPITLMLQPMNFTTLAMKLNYMANTEVLNDIGFYALSLMLINTLFVSLLIGMMHVSFKKRIS